MRGLKEGGEREEGGGKRRKLKGLYIEKERESIIK